MEYISTKQIVLRMFWCEVKPVKCKLLPAMYIFPRELRHPPAYRQRSPKRVPKRGPSAELRHPTSRPQAATSSMEAHISQRASPGLVEATKGLL